MPAITKQRMLNETTMVFSFFSSTFSSMYADVDQEAYVKGVMDVVHELVKVCPLSLSVCLSLFGQCLSGLTRDYVQGIQAHSFAAGIR